MRIAKPRLLGVPTTWGRLFLGAGFLVLTLIAMYAVFNTRWQFYIPRLAVQCLSWNFGVVDKWDTDVEVGKPYAFYARHMGLHPDGEKIAKIFAADAFDVIEIDRDENVRVNGQVQAHGLQLAAQLGHQRSDFMGRGVLEPGEFFGLGTTWNSFDSRYWGAIHESQVFGRLYLLF